MRWVSIIFIGAMAVFLLRQGIELSSTNEVIGGMSCSIIALILLFTERGKKNGT